MRYILIDRITDIVPWQTAAGVKSVALGEDFFVDHFPEQPVMPGVMIVEALQQLCSWLIAFSSDFRERGTLVAINTAKFKKFVSPGDRLQLRVELRPMSDERLHADGIVSAEGKVAAQVDMVIARRTVLLDHDATHLRNRFLSLR